MKRKLYHSSGLDDSDFITYFETSKLEDFHSLILALEKVKEFRHNRRFGHPTLLGTVRSLDEISNCWRSSGGQRMTADDLQAH